MKVACSLPILTLNGSNVLHPDGSKATFKSIAVETLLIRKPSDQDAATSYKLYQLAQRIATADFVDLLIEEAAIIKSRVAEERTYNNLVIGRMFDILEGKCNPPSLERVADVVALNIPDKE